MPDRVSVLNIVVIMLHYSLLVLLYYFLYRVSKMIYTDLKLAVQGQQRANSDTAAARDKEARLVVVDSGSVKLDVNSVRIDESLSIGRGEHNDFVIAADTFISNEHSCITRYKNEYWLNDLNSTNGTFLNGQQVTSEVLLKDGDVIKIGAVTFKFER